jgi:acetyl esterase/lipase
MTVVYLPQSRAPMRRDFSALAALRRMMGSFNPLDNADYGRPAVEAWISRFIGVIAEGVTAEPFSGGLRLTPNVPSGQHLYYVHGGGLVFYRAELFVPMLSQIAAASGLTVSVFDYPKAPETATTQILEYLSQTVAEALTHHPTNAPSPLIAGDSVGATLALFLSQSVFPGGFAQVHLLYPVLTKSRPPSPYDQGYFLDALVMEWFQGFIDPVFDPLGGPPDQWPPERLAALPPVTIHAAECDLLRGEAEAFAECCREAGVLRNYSLHQGMPHDFCLYAAVAMSARQALQQVIAGFS